MLPNLAVIAGTVGLLIIMGLIYRESAQEMGSTEKTAFGGGALVIVVVALVHLISTAGGGGH